MGTLPSGTTLALTCASLLLAVSCMRGEEPGPVLELRTATGQTTFHLGERIPLQLGFTGPGNSSYQVNTSNYDRSGRMNSETFALTPSSGWSDPLAAYFSSNGGMGGGLSGVLTLSPSRPVEVPLNLNEWIRFDQPGVYKVTVTSNRVNDTRRPALNFESRINLRSNSLELRIILATPKWQAEKIAAILRELSAEPPNIGMPPPQRIDAIADLRYLASRDATMQLAANVREDKTDLTVQAGFGLMGLPDSLRGIAVSSMNQGLDSPSFPVSPWFLLTLSMLEIDSHIAIGDPQALAARIRTERRSVDNAVWLSALSAVPRKQGKARAITVQALLDFAHEGTTPEIEAQAAALLSESFLDLPEQSQTTDLLYHWDHLHSQTMLPTLRVLARLPLPKPGSNLSTAYSTRELKSAALRRWYDLEPEAARREIFAQIGAASPTLTAQAISFLPQQPLPQFEGLWADALLHSSDYEQQAVIAALLARFGSGTAAPQLVSILNDKVGEWACAPQAAALAYLVRFDPDAARPLLKQALDARGKGKTACNHTLFQDVSAHAAAPVMTEAALGSLDDPDPQVTGDALLYLISCGDASAESPVWDRYVKWSEQWTGKTDTLEHGPSPSIRGNLQQIGLGENLARALIANQGWLADANLIARVQKMCVGDRMCGQLKQFAASAEPPYRVDLFQSSFTQNFGIAQYSAKSLDLLDAKISQFPKGTVFVLNPGSPQDEDQKKLQREARALFKKQGMTLQTPTVPNRWSP